jgi:hypothetical protein
LLHVLTAASGPFRHLVRRSDPVALGVEANIQSPLVCGPRLFASRDCSIERFK